MDVSYADERNGLLLATSIKSICFAPFGKNLKNRFGDLCTEAITLHLRFPYSVVTALFTMPAEANQGGIADSSFKKATRLFSTISGRREYTDPGEKFESVTMMLFQPKVEDLTIVPWVHLFDAKGQELSEANYFDDLLQTFNARNPHMVIGELEE